MWGTPEAFTFAAIMSGIAFVLGVAYGYKTGFIRAGRLMLDRLTKLGAIRSEIICREVEKLRETKK